MIALYIVGRTTYVATSDDKVVKLTIFLLSVIYPNSIIWFNPY